MRRLLDFLLTIILMATSPAQATILSAEIAEDLRDMGV